MSSRGAATALGRVQVLFEGVRSGVAPITWGQRAIWNAIRRTAPGDHYFNFGRILFVPTSAGSVSVAEASAQIAALFTRHESLRTRLLLSPTPSQRLTARGRFELDVVRCEVEEVASTAEHVREDLASRRFDYEHEWPIRVAFVVSGDAIRAIVLVFCHLAADGHAGDIVVRDLRLGLLGRKPVVETHDQPLDIARRQQSPTGHRADDNAITYWRRELQRIPPTMFARPASRPAQAKRFWRGAITSRALDLAVAKVAARHRVSTSTVLVASASAMVSSYTGLHTCAMMPIVSNRFRPSVRQAVTTLSQDGLFAIDVDLDANLGEFIARSWQQSLLAYRHAEYDPDHLAQIVEQVSAERATSVHPYCCFNDMRLVDESGLVSPPQASSKDIADAVEETTFDWPLKLDTVSCRFCLHVTGEPGKLTVSLTADTTYLPPEAIERYLRNLETFVVDAAVDDAPLRDLLERH